MCFPFTALGYLSVDIKCLECHINVTIAKGTNFPEGYMLKSAVAKFNCNTSGESGTKVNSYLITVYVTLCKL